MDIKSLHQLGRPMTGVSVLLVISLSQPGLAKDTELDSGPRVFPYNGVLELNGAAVNGPIDFMFTLTDDASCTFNEEHNDVNVYAGRFAVNIGSVAGQIPDCVFDADAVYIAIGVREATSSGAYTTLSGRRRIHPVPFAYWAAEASDLHVDGIIESTGSITAGGNLSVKGSDLLLGQNDGRVIGSATNQRALVHNAVNGQNDALIVNYAGDFEGGTWIDSRTTVDGNLTVNGTINGLNLSGSGLTCTNVSYTDNSPQDDEEISVSCASGYTMTGCSAYSSWNNIDGVYINDNGACVVRSSGGGNWFSARGRCCKLQ